MHTRSEGYTVDTMKGYLGRIRYLVHMIQASLPLSLTTGATATSEGKILPPFASREDLRSLLLEPSMQERVLTHCDSEALKHHRTGVNFFLSWLCVSRDGDKLVRVKVSNHNSDVGVKGSVVSQKSETHDQERILAGCGALLGPDLQAELLEALK